LGIQSKDVAKFDGENVVDCWWDVVTLWFFDGEASGSGWRERSLGMGEQGTGNGETRAKQRQDKDKNEMRGSLHCATHDGTVSGSGRDDAVFDR
jgi:hypothetical protein